ncbi:oxidoreductase [Brevirhabdus pacifica]|uniref:Oxidoreductase n=1 Tax=Brevirhabdus pacifica TaxID=1267768 RepID=A0A1U7DKZ4_9RHOB|nr:DUF934 domain-containing protein [Brevirhabdus pacifica]APX90674.1 oxidoreductase [Brevirhabdus pacifica]OWU78344.1 putative oxidoreductase [Loktanella sp. 22II-4b]PJJ85177.1 uncharacterized protein DUF934 [Brevirhabdus pacifica]
MNVIVTDRGFGHEAIPTVWISLAEALSAPAEGVADLRVHLDPDTDPAALAPLLGRLGAVRVAFPSSADGRGFTIARQLRLMGYEGSLRAYGHVIADQYSLARRAGFDDVEISHDLASRQPEHMWTGPESRRQQDYQARLRG